MIPREFILFAIFTFGYYKVVQGARIAVWAKSGEDPWVQCLKEGSTEEEWLILYTTPIGWQVRSDVPITQGQSVDVILTFGLKIQDCVIPDSLSANRLTPSAKGNLDLSKSNCEAHARDQPTTFTYEVSSDGTILSVFFKGSSTFTHNRRYYNITATVGSAPRIASLTCYLIPNTADNYCRDVSCGIVVGDLVKSRASSCINVVSPTSGSRSHTCNCTEFWKGEECLVDINECKEMVNPKACESEGNCTNVAGNPGWRCSCLAGFSGKRCDQDENFCASEPCANGGTCKKAPGSYICNCPVGTNGTNCEIDLNECLSSPCKGESRCVDELNKYTCRCQNGNVGTKCQFREPALPDINCPKYVVEGDSINCKCFTLDEGIPPAVVGWVNVTGNLVITNVTRTEAQYYTCKVKWSLTPEQRGQEDIQDLEFKKIYKLQPAYGPTVRYSYIVGPPKPTATDGNTPITLTCYCNPCYPSPTVEWEGTLCDGSQLSSTCTFIPDPDVDNKANITCTLTNVVVKTFISKKTYTLELLWTGQPRVRSFTVAGKENELFSPEKGKSLQMECLGIGSPKPEVRVKREGTTMKSFKSDNTRQCCLKRLFTTTSPKICGTAEKYQCLVSNHKGEDTKYLSVVSNCTELPPQEDSSVTMYAVLGILGLIAMSMCTSSAAVAKRKKQKEKEQALQRMKKQRLEAVMAEKAKPAVKEEAPRVSLDKDTLALYTFIDEVSASNEDNEADPAFQTSNEEEEEA